VMRVIAGNVSTNVRDFAERKNIAKPGIAKKSAGKETCPAITRITRRKGGGKRSLITGGNDAPAGCLVVSFRPGVPQGQPVDDAVAVRS